MLVDGIHCGKMGCMYGVPASYLDDNWQTGIEHMQAVEVFFFSFWPSVYYIPRANDRFSGFPQGIGYNISSKSAHICAWRNYISQLSHDNLTINRPPFGYFLETVGV